MKHLVIVFLTLVLMTGIYAGTKEHQPQHEEAVVITLPPVTLEAPMVEANLKTNPLVPFAHALPVTLDIYNSGEWLELPNGSREWTMKITSPGATSLQLQFNRLELPKGTSLSIYDVNGTLVEVLTAENQTSINAMLSALYPGHQITLVYREPQNTGGQANLEISNIMQGYRDIFTMPQGYEAAGLVIADGVRAGYGLLVNNNAKNFKPYLLIPFAAIDTAGLDASNPHYGDGQLQADELKATENWQFCFKSQVPTAENNEIWVTFQGCTVKSISPQNGLALVEMKEAPFEKNVKVIYHGWSAESNSRVNTDTRKTEGLPGVNAQKMIIGNIFNESDWRLPQNGNYVGSNATETLTAGKTLVLNADSESPSPLPPVPGPVISPNVSGVLCTPILFELDYYDPQCNNNTYTWEHSSNLEYESGKDKYGNFTKFYQVRPKKGTLGTGWVRCTLNSCGSVFLAVTETFNIVCEPSDLYPTQCSVSPTIVAPGDTLSMSAQVMGNSNSYSYLYYYLSSNNILEANDTLITSKYVGSVGASGSYECATYTIPAGLTEGDWYIIFKTDATNRISETDENNNTCYAQFKVIDNSKADLIPFMQSVRGTYTQIVSPGESVTIECRVKNTGNKTSGPSTLHIYYAPTAPTGTLQEMVGSFSIGGLAPNAYSQKISTQFTLPLIAPTEVYFIFVADANQQVAEENESNNTDSLFFAVDSPYEPW